MAKKADLNRPTRGWQDRCLAPDLAEAPPTRTGINQTTNGTAHYKAANAIAIKALKPSDTCRSPY